MSNTVDDFLAKLAANAPKEKREFAVQNNRSLEKVYLNFPGNFGRYQVFPMNSVIEGSIPFVRLPYTREISIPRKIVKPDGTENVFNSWVKILNRGAYKMKDLTGRVVSSLTASEETLLSQAQNIWDQLWEELGGRDCSLEIQKNFIRHKNYTIFHGMCLNKWDPNESRNPKKQNFSALFVFTSDKFYSGIQENIQEKTLMNNGNNEWLSSIYNRELSGRTGFLMFSVNLSKSGPGFSITTTHEVGNESFKNISIDPEDAELMSDPLYTFLGAQANKDDENQVGFKRLFNVPLITEAIHYMTEQLAAIRSAKAMGGIDIREAIRKTSDAAMNANIIYQKGGNQTTNDPILAAAQGEQSSFGQTTVVNPEAIRTENTNPFSSAPVYHADPVTGAPVDNNPSQSWGGGFGGGTSQQSAPFSPNFGGFGGNQGTTDDLPF